jgi:hypothetical protein
MRHAIGLAELCLFQLDSLREFVEQATAPSEQDIDQVDSDLVHEPRGEELLVDVGAHSPIRLSAATSWACTRAGSIPSETNVNNGSELGGGSWVTTKHETSPSGPFPPHASIELS